MLVIEKTLTILYASKSREPGKRPRADDRTGAMSIYEVAPLDLSSLRTIDLASRPSKVGTSLFARPVTAADASIIDALPDTLAAADLRKLARAIVAANHSGRRVIAGWGRTS
jgi:hypothetical protein